MEGGGGGGARVLGVDDGDAADADVSQGDLAADHLLAGDEAGGGVAHDRDIQLRLVDAGGGEGALDSLPRDILHAAVQELAEPGHVRADDGDVSHGILLGFP
jgi:hypothetical protein